MQTAVGQSKLASGPVITISGYVREAGSQEALIGVNVYRAGNNPLGTTTNTYGFYSLTVPIGPSLRQDSLRLTYSIVGYDTQEQTVSAQKSQTVKKKDRTPSVSTTAGPMATTFPTQALVAPSKRLGTTMRPPRPTNMAAAPTTHL